MKKSDQFTPGFPKRVPLSGRMLVLGMMFAVFALVIGYGIPFMLFATITFEDGTPLPLWYRIIFAFLASIVEIGVLSLVLPILSRAFGKRGAMTLTKNGVEDTFVIFTIFAFWTTLRVRMIPWEALTPDETDPDVWLVDTKLLPRGSTCWLARLILMIMGFPFSVGKIKGSELAAARAEALAQKADFDPPFGVL
ncbi:MAG: hypothetical protein IJZ80_09110 [Clostridia bacterium]|nr:hypothetical protein [Clostridia bacterium]